MGLVVTGAFPVFAGVKNGGLGIAGTAIVGRDVVWKQSGRCGNPQWVPALGERYPYMIIIADCVAAEQCATAFEVGDDKTMPSTVFPQRGGSIVGKRAETRSAKQCDKVCAPIALAVQGFVPACRAALRAPPPPFSAISSHGAPNATAIP